MAGANNRALKAAGIPKATIKTLRVENGGPRPNKRRPTSGRRQRKRSKQGRRRPRRKTGLRCLSTGYRHRRAPTVQRNRRGNALTSGLRPSPPSIPGQSPLQTRSRRLDGDDPRRVPKGSRVCFPARMPTPKRAVSEERLPRPRPAQQSLAATSSKAIASPRVRGLLTVSW